MWNWLREKKRFRYSFLCFQRSLGSGTGQRVAVIAETKIHDGRALVVAGRDIDLNGLDPLSQRIVGQVREWLEAEIDEAFEEAGEEDPLDYLAASNPWNLYFTDPVEQTTSDFLQSVIDLFAREVLEIQQVEALVESQMGRQPGFMTLEMPGLSSRQSMSSRRRVPAG